MACTWNTHGIHMACHTHGTHMATWDTHEMHMAYTWGSHGIRTHGVHMAYTWNAHGVQTAYTSGTHMEYTAYSVMFGHVLSCFVMSTFWTCCCGQACIHDRDVKYTWRTNGIHMGCTWHTHGMRMGYTWHADGIHMECTWDTHGQVKYTWHTHGIHMSYVWPTHGIQVACTWHTYGIHMKYTSYSVMLCHALSCSVMDVVGHWGCNPPGDCKFIVLHFNICPGAVPCAGNKTGVLATFSE